MMRFFRSSALVALIVAVSGCASDASTLKKKALWICLHDQAEGPWPRFYPAEKAAFAEHFTKEDLDFRAAKDARDEIPAGFFEVGVALHESTLRHATCEVAEPVISGDTADVVVMHTRPKGDPGDTYAAVSNLGSHAERVAYFDAEFARATEKVERSAIIPFKKTPAGWRAHFDMKKRALDAERALLESDIHRLVVRKNEAEMAQKELAAFAILKRRFQQRKGILGTEPTIELTVRNGLSWPISRAYFRGTLRTPGRSIPWLREEFNYEISGGIEPGETLTWKLAPNPYQGKWGSADPPAGAEFIVEVLRVDGAEGRPIWDATGLSDREIEELARLQAELAAAEK